MKVKDKKQPDNLNWQKSQDAWAKKKKGTQMTSGRMK